MSRSKLLLLVLVLALSLGTIGSAFAQGNVLTVWADEERAPILRELADDVLADLGIELNVEDVGFGDIRDQLLVAGPVGEGPDILIGAHDWIGVLVSNAAIIPLDLGDRADEFSPSALDLWTYEGQLYGMPYARENLALVRNVDLVPEAPATWEDVLAMAPDFAANDQYAFLLQTGDAYHAFPLQTAFGGYVFGFNDDGTYNPADVGFDDPGSVAFAQWMNEMYSNGYMVPSVGGNEILAAFEEGNLGMFVTGPWSSQDIYDSGINYSIDAIPGSSSEMGRENGIPFLGGQAFMISAFSTNQLLAEIFLYEYVATQEVMQGIFEADPRPSAYLTVDISVDANAAAFDAAGTEAQPMPTIPEMGAVWGSAGAAQNLVSQGEDPVETYTNAATQIRDAIVLVQSTERIVGLPGSWQAAVGCEGDWDPACEVTFMEAQGDGIFTLTIDVPAGEYEFKVAMNGGWDENYGVDGVAGGDNLALVLDADATVTFTYDDNTNVVTFEVE